MLTIGVDLSAQDTKTCMASIEWKGGRARVIELQSRVSNLTIVSAAAGADKIGIDCPFGWPTAFVEFIAEHAQGPVQPRQGIAINWRRALANRTTDLVVRKKTPLTPLSVSADRISHAAMRCAALLSELSAAGFSIDRTGQSGAVVEVYPAASLHRWDLRYRGYKGSGHRPQLSTLVDDLLTAAPWLDLAEYEYICRTSDDALDAVIASLTARAERCALTDNPDAEQASAAACEGWIALPRTGSLNLLPMDRSY